MCCKDVKQQQTKQKQSTYLAIWVSCVDFSIITNAHPGLKPHSPTHTHTWHTHTRAAKTIAKCAHPRSRPGQKSRRNSLVSLSTDINIGFSFKGQEPLGLYWKHLSSFQWLFFFLSPSIVVFFPLKPSLSCCSVFLESILVQESVMLSILGSGEFLNIYILIYTRIHVYAHVICIVKPF